MDKFSDSEDEVSEQAENKHSNHLIQDGLSANEILEHTEDWNAIMSWHEQKWSNLTMNGTYPYHEDWTLIVHLV